MARPLRIDYENAWHHVMNRGANHQTIFFNNEHRFIFLTLLEEISAQYKIEIHAFCLMDNHYHLLLRTPYANLSRAMRHLNGVYTQKINFKQSKDGAIFRGRYKSILIENNQYLLNVSRYIHLNPVAAQLCHHPAEYVWSSYRYYVSNKKINWLTTQLLLAQVGDDYAKFVEQGVDEETTKFYSARKTSCIYGSSEFKNKIKNSLPTLSLETRGDIKTLVPLPSIVDITNVVMKYFAINEKELLTSIKNKTNLPRLIAIFLCRKIGLCTYKKIAKYFCLQNPYSVRSAIRRLDCYLRKNSSSRNILEEIVTEIEWGQV